MDERAERQLAASRAFTQAENGLKETPECLELLKLLMGMSDRSVQTVRKTLDDEKLMDLARLCTLGIVGVSNNHVALNPLAQQIDRAMIHPQTREWSFRR